MRRRADRGRASRSRNRALKRHITGSVSPFCLSGPLRSKSPARLWASCSSSPCSSSPCSSSCQCSPSPAPLSPSQSCSAPQGFSWHCLSMFRASVSLSLPSLKDYEEELRSLRSAPAGMLFSGLPWRRASEPAPLPSLYNYQRGRQTQALRELGA